MKCPFRSIKTTEKVVAGKIIRSTEQTEFQDCLEEDCPYYEIRNVVKQTSCGYVATKSPVCKKAN